MSLVPHTGGSRTFEELQCSSHGLFTATGCPVLVRDYRKMKEDMQSTTRKTMSRSMSSSFGVDPHEPWTPPWDVCPPKQQSDGDVAKGEKPQKSSSAIAFHPLGMATDL